MDLPFGGLGMVGKDLIVVGSRPELTRLAFVEEVRGVWVRKRMQPKIL